MLPMDDSGTLLRQDVGEEPSAPAHPMGRALSSERARVDGKCLARGPARLRVRGVTYGPFAIGADGTALPPPQRVDEDFARMGAAGINSIRIYHLPPAWLL